jgi:hypothetical protein
VTSIIVKTSTKYHTWRNSHIIITLSRTGLRLWKTRNFFTEQKYLAANTTTSRIGKHYTRLKHHQPTNVKSGKELRSRLYANQCCRFRNKNQWRRLITVHCRLRCINTMGLNESISHESNKEHLAASTLCDSSLDSNEDQSAASTIDYDNAVHPFDALEKLC